MAINNSPRKETNEDTFLRVTTESYTIFFVFEKEIIHGLFYDDAGILHQRFVCV
jgi:hypothetical protein